MFSKYKWTPKNVKVDEKANGRFSFQYFSELDSNAIKNSSPRKSFDTELVDVVLYPTEFQFTVMTYHKESRYVMTFRAETEHDYNAWSIYFRKKMDKRSVRVQVNVVEHRATMFLGFMTILTIWFMLYIDEVSLGAFLDKYHKAISLTSTSLIALVFANRFTSGAVADIMNVIPFRYIELSMMFVNMIILAIFTFFYDETIKHYFTKSCSAATDSTAMINE